jgi:regulator of sigma E protease
MFITIVSFILILGVLVFFHELGHYVAARKNGIVVEEFGVFGFPPRLFKLFNYDGTDFTINLIPLGAFVRMKGEDGADLSPGSFNAASAGARAMVLIAGPAMNAVLAVILFAASFMAGFPAPGGSPLLTEVPPNTMAAQIGLQPNDILLFMGDSPVLVSDIPGTKFDIKAEQGETQLVISRDGDIVRLTVPPTTSVDDLLKDVNYRLVLMTRITAVQDGTPAEKANLQPGDRIYAVNDVVVTPEMPVNQLVGQHLGEEIKLTVLRDHTWVTVNTVPRQNPPEGQGPLGIGISEVPILGVLPPLQALWNGLVTTFQYVQLVLMLPVMLLFGTLAPSDAGIAGPVGIAQMVGGAVSATIDTGYWYPIWRLSAIISAGLAIANLLPLPALDGGRLLFILIEKLRGRRIDPEKEGLVHMIGFMLLLGMMVLVTVSDLTSAPQSINWHLLLGQ